MLFSELVEAELDPALLPDVDRLLELKMSAPEIKTIPKIESINRYLDSSIEELRSRIVPLPEDTNHGWERPEPSLLLPTPIRDEAFYTTGFFTS